MSEISKEMVENKDFVYNEPYKKEEKTCGIRGESGCDFVLPDYMGDVKKLLKFSAVAVPCSKFCGSGEVSFLGTVTYRVMYLDKEDVLTEASFTSEYEHNERCPEGFLDAAIEAKIQNLTVRLQGPRKICAKASLTYDVFMNVERSVECCGISDLAEHKERCVNIHCAKYFPAAEREYAEPLGSIENVSADEVEAVKYGAAAFVESVKPGDDGVELIGYIFASALLRVDGELIFMEKKIPFDELLLSDETLTEGAHYSANAYVTGCTLNINNDRASDDSLAAVASSVVISVTAELDARADFNCEHKLIIDAFVKGCTCDNTYSVFTYNEMVCATCDKKSFTAQLPKKEAGAEGMHSIIEAEATLKGVKADIAEGAVKINAEAVFSVVANGNGGEDVFSFKCPIEYEKTVTLPKAPCNNASLRCTLWAENVSVTHDTENVYFSCDVHHNVIVEKRCEEKVLSNMSTVENDDDGRGRVIVYYPENGDTLWTVAKKYGVAVSDIIENNPLGDIYTLPDAEEYALDSAGKILIVKR